MALSRVVSVPVVLHRWHALPRLYTSCVGTSRVRSLPAGTGNMALKPPFSSLYYSSEVLRPEASTPLPCRLLHGHSYRAAPSTVTPTVPPPPQSLLPMGIGGWPHLAVGASYDATSSMVVPTRGYQEVTPIGCECPSIRTQSTPEASQCPRPVNARGRSMPEAGQCPRLVNARGLSISLLISLCP